MRSPAPTAVLLPFALGGLSLALGACGGEAPSPGPGGTSAEVERPSQAGPRTTDARATGPRDHPGDDPGDDPGDEPGDEPGAGAIPLLSASEEPLDPDRFPQVGYWHSEENPLAEETTVRHMLGHSRLRSSVQVRISDARRSVIMHAPGRWRAPAVRVPRDARLRFSYRAALPESYLAAMPLRWTVQFFPEGRGRPQLVFERLTHLQPGGGGPWREARVDLRSLAGRRGRLEFAIEWAAPDLPVPADLRIAWGNPWLIGSGAPAPPNVLFLSIDTLRRDVLSPYGADPAHTPNIQALADRGVTFERYFSAAPWTLPSYATLFTAEYPSTHGAGFDHYRVDPTGGKGILGLSRAIPSLVEDLDRAGYLTQAFFSNGHLRMGSGIERGFQGYTLFGMTSTAAADMFDDWLERVDERPFFCFVQLVDVHWPYVLPASFEPLTEVPEYGSVESIEDGFALQLFREGVPDDDRSPFEATYKGLVQYMDRSVGLLLESLERAGKLENTLIVLHSDHGEEFWEHDNWWHGHTHHAELERVPLIFSFPSVLPQGSRVREAVRGPDVLPTVLDLIGLWDPDARTTEGTSIGHLLVGVEGETPVAFSEGLLYGPYKAFDTEMELDGRRWRLVQPPPAGEAPPSPEGEDTHEAEGAGSVGPRRDPRVPPLQLYDLDGEDPEANVVLEHADLARRLADRALAAFSVTSGPWRLVKLPLEEPRLYDLDADPLEQTDLAAREPERTAELYGLGLELRQRARERSQGPGVPQGEDTSGLAALGYAGEG